MDPLNNLSRYSFRILAPAFVIGVFVAPLFSGCSKGPEPVPPPNPAAVAATFGDRPVTAAETLTAFQESRTFDDLWAADARENESNPLPAGLPQLATGGVGEMLRNLVREYAFNGYLAEKARDLGLHEKESFLRAHRNNLNEELYSKVVIEEILKKIPLTEKDLHQFYETRKDTLYKMKDSDVFRIRGIYVFKEGKSREEALARISEAMEKLEGGASFETVALQYSEAPRGKRGIEMAASPSQFNDPGITNRLFGMRDGEHTDIIESGDKFLVLQRLGYEKPRYAPFEQIRQLIIRQLVQERIEARAQSLYQQLAAKHDPLLLPEAVENPGEYEPTTVILSAGDAFSLTLEEFQTLAASQRKNTLRGRLDYFNLLARKSVFLAEAKSRGWTEETVEATVAFWDNRRLADEYIGHLASQHPISEEEIRAFYEANRDDPRFTVPEIYDLYYLLIPAGYDPSMSQAESIEAFQLAHQTALRAMEEFENGRAFEDVVAMYSRDPSLLKTRGHIGRVTMGQLDPPMSAALSNAKLEPGEIGRPQEVFSAKYGRYGYEIYHARDIEPPRPMNYGEARALIERTWETGVGERLRGETRERFFEDFTPAFDENVLNHIQDYLLFLAEQPDRQAEITQYTE